MNDQLWTASRLHRSFPHSVHIPTHFTRVALASRASSFLNKSTTMHSLDEALVFLNSQDVPNVSEAARKFQIERSTLSKKFKRQSGSRAQAAEKKQLLSIKQEKTLIKDINRLCERGFPPTPCMVANIAGQIAKKQPGKNWTSRFVKRWSEKLDSRYLKTLDVSRHKAECEDSFKMYFDTLRVKLSSMEYSQRTCTTWTRRASLLDTSPRARGCLPRLYRRVRSPPHSNPAEKCPSHHCIGSGEGKLRGANLRLMQSYLRALLRCRVEWSKSMASLLILYGSPS